MNNILATLAFVLMMMHVSAQDTNSVVVHKDPRIDLLVSKQIEINDITTRNSRRNAPGFRIQVISSNNRNKVLEAKTKMYQRFPELKAYMMYQSPFFRLKVGNFTDRADAETYLSGIQKLFQDNVYVVPDTVEVKPEESNN
jgi:hypothetical protein